MHVFVQTGFGVRCFSFDSEFVSGKQIKASLCDSEGIPCDLQRLKCSGFDLRDDQLLNSAGSTIVLCLRLHGGKVRKFNYNRYLTQLREVLVQTCVEDK